jgi:hypothetical protein
MRDEETPTGETAAEREAWRIVEEATEKRSLTANDEADWPATDEPTPGGIGQPPADPPPKQDVSEPPHDT